MYLALRTDNPQAELYMYDTGKKVASLLWQAHRKLSATIHYKIQEVCDQAGIKLDNINGIIFYSGPGSFTGLRIGVAVANALGASYDIPVVGTSGDDWLRAGLANISTKHSFVAVEPYYGGEATTTLPKK